MGSCISTVSNAEIDLHRGVIPETDLHRVVKNDMIWLIYISSFTVTSHPRTQGGIIEAANLVCFCFSELAAATGHFINENVLGSGEFGVVYKGWVDEHSLKATSPEMGMPIAVKKLRDDSCQGQQEWLTEIKYLGHLCHPNLVKLMGYCIEDKNRLLVYEFMPNSSLDRHLFETGHSPVQTITWHHRIKVALNVAKALAFLHHEVDAIHRDVKPSNILLDANYNAKLSDFGLAKDGSVNSRTHVTTRVLGTEGYYAPEYMESGHLTTKCEVYSFGVVLLELLCGRPAIDINRPYKEANLVQWARPSLSPRKIFRILDARCFSPFFLSESVLKTAELISLCVSSKPMSRPTMREVVEALGKIQELNRNVISRA
ncbi:probable serine/threonine-protein kinase PBL10 isoform X3 [Manihot esculenta]|uniref:probable serine/threonine-protein kinase PBL10 isoform X3 n=1 Tax=Manihot esculenta TaxID=3983 RepID=UPI000B5D6A83|nr:probable serine/threonine-protein kinase PBL10 isoform X3 [Manihot esculenta]